MYIENRCLFNIKVQKQQNDTVMVHLLKKKPLSEPSKFLFPFQLLLTFFKHPFTETEYKHEKQSRQHQQHNYSLHYSSWDRLMKS